MWQTSRHLMSNCKQCQLKAWCQQTVNFSEEKRIWWWLNYVLYHQEGFFENPQKADNVLNFLRHLAAFNFLFDSKNAGGTKPKVDRSLQEVPLPIWTCVVNICSFISNYSQPHFLSICCQCQPNTDGNSIVPFVILSRFHSFLYIPGACLTAAAQTVGASDCGITLSLFHPIIQTSPI